MPKTRPARAGPWSTCCWLKASRCGRPGLTTSNARIWSVACSRRDARSSSAMASGGYHHPTSCSCNASSWAPSCCACSCGRRSIWRERSTRTSERVEATGPRGSGCLARRHGPMPVVPPDRARSHARRWRRRRRRTRSRRVLTSDFGKTDSRCCRRNRDDDGVDRDQRAYAQRATHRQKQADRNDTE